MHGLLIDKYNYGIRKMLYREGNLGRAFLIADFCRRRIEFIYEKVLEMEVLKLATKIHANYH